GIYVDGSAMASGNVVHGNDVGIQTHAYTTVDSNQVYDNRIGLLASYAYDTTITANRVYSNSEGIRVEGQNNVTIANNLVYANTNSAIYLRDGYLNAGIIGNTLYQAVGDAVTIEASSEVRLFNNIVWVENGAAINVTGDAVAGFRTDYNLVQLGAGSSVSYGIFAGMILADLSAWQNATGDAIHSLSADPLFLDVNGIDNLLGYVNGVDYSRDDNWALAKNSPAIDSGHSWQSLSTDAVGSARRNDLATPDLGSLDYVEQSPTSSPFDRSGTAMDWKGSSPDYSWQYTLPFAFSYFDQSYTTATISTGGLIQFEGNGWIHWDETALERFADSSRITAFWDNLRTDGADDNLFIDESVPDRVTIRWDATHVTEGTDVDFAVTLYANGEFSFHYGSDVTTSPVAGYANHEFARTHTAATHGTQSFAANQSIDFNLLPGQVDLGSLEFRGSSDDVVAPVVSTTFPDGISKQQSISTLIESIRILFSEEVNYFDAGSFAAYELREAGPNGTFGDGDDLVYQLVPKFALGDSFVDLQVLFSQGAQGPPPQGGEQFVVQGHLPEGNYQFAIQSDLTGGVRDTAGLLMDGDNNGTVGGTYVRQFDVFFLPEFASLSLSPTVNEGSVARLSGEITDYSFATSHSVQVDWGDGTPVVTYDIAAGQTYFQIDRAYAQDSVSAPSGQFAVTATLVNNLGRSSQASDPHGIAVNNVSPTLSSLTAPTDVHEDQVFMLTGQLVDPGLADTHVLSIDWGDGSAIEQVTLAVGARDFSIPHTYTNVASRLTPLDRTISLTVVDESLVPATLTRMIRLTPTNTAPSIANGVLGVLEMADNGTVVGQVINTDPDLLAPNVDSQAFSIVGGTGLGKFAINNDGVITVFNGAALDYESTKTYSLLIEVVDGHGFKDFATITINLGNVPETEAIKIDGGTAQRSVVRKITVNFDSDVVLDPATFEIERIGGGLFTPAFTTDIVNGKTVATLTFAGNSEISGSLADGNYRLQVNHQHVTAAGTQMRADYVDNFFRLFGDTDGDRDVDGQDYGRFGLSFLKAAGSPGFNPALDFDGDGDVDGQDYGNFGRRFLKRLSE
ncbi:right-handed parallel beta-helix repeat-containing protein, partial [Stieleria sp. ICT_E10.1]|uniref:right-handed parallel beta-helix repeat-containing protein n=1 Tax=Stieleria sedimenti TaxID=2976331 RepID=UPI002180212C